MAIKELIRNHVQQKTAGVLIALITGDKTGIQSEITESFRRSGLSHVLAVSGMHVGIFYGASVLLLSLLGVKEKTRIIIGQITMWAFIVFTGGATSTLRAGLMLLGWSGGRLIGRRGSGLNGFCLTIFILLLIHPFSLFQAGFQMSAGAVLGILWFEPTLSARWPFDTGWLKRIGQMVAVTCAAQLGVIPALFFHFHQFSGVFIWSNLLMLPLLAPILYIGVLAIMLKMVGIDCGWIWKLEDTLLDLLIDGSDRIGGAGWSISDFPWDANRSLWLIGLLVVIRIWMLKRSRWLKYVLVILLNGLLWSGSLVPDEETRQILLAKGKCRAVLRYNCHGADVIWLSGQIFDSRLTKEDIPKFLERERVERWKIWPAKNFSEWPVVGYSKTLIEPDHVKSSQVNEHGE
jgi:competence protein ComEC